MNISDAYRWRELTKFYEQNKDIYPALLGVLAQATPFVGAGLSMFAGYPDWPNALKKMSSNQSIYDDICRLVDIEYDLFSAGEMLYSHFNGPLLQIKLRKCFPPERIKKEELRQQAVWLLPRIFQNKICITTNFDEVLEEVYQARAVRSHYPYVPSQSDSIINAFRNGESPIIHLHGRLGGNWEDIVLSESSYQKHYRKNSPMMLLLNRFLSEDCLLFLGASLKNDRTVERLRKLPIFGKPHFAILPARTKIEAQERSKELESLKIVPLFYPNPSSLGHQWVKIILEWLLNGWKPDESIISDLIDSDDYFRYDVHLGLNTFSDPQSNISSLISFLEWKRVFAWWEVCGKGDGGKTRLLLELKKWGEENNWNVHYFDQKNYAYLMNRHYSMEKNTLIILDDADYYDADFYDWRIQDFIDLLRFLNERASETQKLRVLFTYTSPKRSDQNPWWWDLRNYWTPIITNQYQPKALEIEWNLQDIERLITHYITEKYAANIRYRQAELTIKHFLFNSPHKDLRTPLFGIMLVDAFFSEDSLEEVWRKLVIRLSRVSEKRPSLGIRENALIEEAKEYVEFFYEIGHQDLASNPINSPGHQDDNLREELSSSQHELSANNDERKRNSGV